MAEEQKNNPLHGVKLAEIVEFLVDKYGWEELGTRIKINCFLSNPTVKSSLTFLRKTEWAREKVEFLYLKTLKHPLPKSKFASKPFSKPDSRDEKRPFSSRSTGKKMFTKKK